MCATCFYVPLTGTWSTSSGRMVPDGIFFGGWMERGFVDFGQSTFLSQESTHYNLVRNAYCLYQSSKVNAPNFHFFRSLF
jgi:hypothetical protein